MARQTPIIQRNTGWRHEITVGHSRPLWVEENLQCRTPCWQADDQDRNSRVFLIRDRRRWVAWESPRLAGGEGCARGRIENGDAHGLSVPCQCRRRAIRSDSRISVHPPLNGLRGRYLVLQQDLPPAVDKANSSLDRRPANKGQLHVRQVACGTRETHASK